MVDQAKTFMVEDAPIIFRNFAGKEGQFNREGDRNFSVILPKEIAEQMLADGWNVRYLEAREEGDEDTAYVSVAVTLKTALLAWYCLLPRVVLSLMKTVLKFWIMLISRALILLRVVMIGMSMVRRVLKHISSHYLSRSKRTP